MLYLSVDIKSKCRRTNQENYVLRQLTGFQVGYIDIFITQTHDSLTKVEDMQLFALKDS